MRTTLVSLFATVAAIIVVMLQPSSAAETRGEWVTALQKGKAEGKIVLAIPPRELTTGSPISRQVKRHRRCCENLSSSLFQSSWNV